MGVPFYSCVAEPKGVAERLCKCANCGMNEIKKER